MYSWRMYAYTLARFFLATANLRYHQWPWAEKLCNHIHFLMVPSEHMPIYWSFSKLTVSKVFPLESQFTARPWLCTKIQIDTRILCPLIHSDSNA